MPISNTESGRPLLIYLHGFLSSPQSYKCQLLKQWLQQERPDVIFYTPLISPYPGEAAESLGHLLEELVRTHNGPVGLAGSSMGGFWSTWLAEQHGLPAVLINPAVHPARLMPKHLEQDLQPYSGELQTYRLRQRDVDTLLELEQSLPTPLEGRYWLLAQRGDETLDCREAEQFYRGQRHTIEEGGDHSFQGFARHMSALVDFLFPNH
ncbi:YqiA/YcfP family alpha/beta fold hydrolase [Microbulbifer celer]|uniref:YqiA/YcfP family alpha/beta fold hydrolase n=1 Tax=Microbulbifer celer TaxID=435905 RepID=A0ABW3U8X2_9GAMM|nr:YqiA/YcfP family alpha/beta fold hydrolase [Microbulbifer celer]UFN57469.1 hypothetical protein LPW13_00040 [Microbulbifer celer]